MELFSFWRKKIRKVMHFLENLRKVEFEHRIINKWKLASNEYKIYFQDPSTDITVDNNDNCNQLL